LVENTRDILEELGQYAEAALSWHNTDPNSSITTPILDQPHANVLENLGFEPISIDSLVERTGLTAETLSSILVVLELHNQVVSVPGGSYVRRG
jgi:DNA processing protein